jgi:ankyrin repeat protein
LHAAARSGNTDILRYLLDEGIDVNIRNTGGYTPFFFAVKGNKYGTVTFLVSVVTDVRHMSFYTPVMAG